MIYHAKEAPINCAHWLTSQKTGILKGVTTACRPSVSSFGRASVCREGGRWFNPRPDREIMLAVIWHLVSVKMIASLGGDDRPLAFSPSSFFHWSEIDGAVNEATLLLEKSRGSFPGGVV